MADYWMDAFMTAETEEEEIAIVDAEYALWQAYEEDEVDLEAWCEEHDVDYWATSDDGISIITRWCWEMCGE
jgi:hypothetical protein